MNTLAAHRTAPLLLGACLLLELPGCASDRAAKKDESAASEAPAGDVEEDAAAKTPAAEARTRDAALPALTATGGASNLDAFWCLHGDPPCEVNDPEHFGPDLDEVQDSGGVFIAPVPHRPDRSFVLVRARAPVEQAAKTPVVLVLLDESDLHQNARRRVSKLLARLSQERAVVWLLPFGDRTGALAPYSEPEVANILARSGPTALTLPPVVDAARQAVRAIDEPLHTVVWISARRLRPNRVDLGAPVVAIDVSLDDDPARARSLAPEGATRVAGFGERDAQDRAVDAIVHHCRGPSIQISFDGGATSYRGVGPAQAEAVVGPRTTLNALVDVERPGGPLHGTATVSCAAPQTSRTMALGSAVVVDDVMDLPAPARRAVGRLVLGRQLGTREYNDIGQDTLREWLEGDPWQSLVTPTSAPEER